MRLYTITPPVWLKWLYGRGFLWTIKTKEKVVYLTFDDGPQPGVTNWVLNVLKEHDAKATFFCIGNNVVINPELYKQIIEEGHAVGNHTHNHLNGLHTSHKEYISNIEQAAKVINSNLFRPPYGRLKPMQARWVKQHYKPVMWTVLAADWDNTVSKEQCLNNVIINTKKGAIIVFHDSLKAEENIRYALPLFLNYLKQQGYKTALIG
jgi:peptidoglycan-N-acetylglucosamine deacetylase